MELLRFATAGSVDDGKSTLIGRLLYDSKTIFEDQLEAVEAHLAGSGRRVHQPGAAHRRPPGRAGAGHHDRRRLPLLRHPTPQVHHRRHPGPHPVHAQHGHRCLHRRRGPDPRRRPQRHHRAVPPALVPRVPAADPAPRGVRQQDGPRRLERGPLRGDQGRVPRLRHEARRQRPHVHPGVAPCWATTSWTGPST